MHYSPAANDHGLPHDPYVALVVPRPIGWISTLNEDGSINLAPYSFFNIVAHKPSYVMFSSAGPKDSQINAEQRGEFVVNVATYDLRDAVNLSSAPVSRGLSEPNLLGLEMAPSAVVKPPRVKLSPAALECRYHQTISLPGNDGKPHPCAIILGEVMSIYIDEEIIVDGIVDIRRMRPLTRLGYLDYGVIDDFFTLPRPSAEDLIAQKERA